MILNLGLLSYDTTFGLGRHEYYLSPEQILLAFKWDFISSPFGIMGVAVPKRAVLVFWLESWVQQDVVGYGLSIS